MKVHARKRKMEARQAALAAGKALAEMASVEPNIHEVDEGSHSDISKKYYIEWNPLNLARKYAGCIWPN